MTDYTTGHCEYNKRPGGCPHHNLHCGWPNCDRRPIESTPPSAASVSERARVSLDLNNLPAEWPWDEGSPCLDPRPVGMVYPAVPTPRAFGYLDKTGVEWAAYDTGQMEEYGRRAFADGANTALRAIEQALTQQRGEAVAWRFVTENRRHGPQLGHWRDVKDAGMPPQSEDLADGVTVEFAYTTNQPSADAVRELVLLSRGLAKRTFNRSTAEMYIHFADKLESLLSAASDHQQNAAQGGGEK